MREILFRGKTEDGRWVEGFLFKYKGEYCIAEGSIMGDDYGLYSTCYDKVIPESIGQFAGLTDNRCKKTFEGDIVVDVERSPLYYPPRVVRFGTGTFDSGVYKYTGFVAMLPDGDAEDGEMISAYVDEFNCPTGWEIIGNIHDNPELLKGE